MGKTGSSGSAAKFITLILGIAVPNGSAFACGAFDIGCEARETLQNPGQKLQEAGRNAERTWNPAPVAKPDLTTMVLDLVTAQLNELESRRRRAAA